MLLSRHLFWVQVEGSANVFFNDLLFQNRRKLVLVGCERLTFSQSKDMTKFGSPCGVRKKKTFKKRART